MATDRHQAPSYPLRMPDELKGRVAEAAEASGRSLHAELLLRLNQSFNLNVDDAALARALMDVAESKLVATKVMGEAAVLAHSVVYLAELLKSKDPRTTAKELAEEIEFAEAAAHEALRAYDRELVPETRLEEYRQAIAATKDLLRVLNPAKLPWDGSAAVKIKKQIKRKAAT